MYNAPRVCRGGRRRAESLRNPEVPIKEAGRDTPRSDSPGSLLSAGRHTNGVSTFAPNGGTSGVRDLCCNTSSFAAERPLPSRDFQSGRSRPHPASGPGEPAELVRRQAPGLLLPGQQFHSRHTERPCRNLCCSQQSSRILSCTRRGGDAGDRLRPDSRQPTRPQWPSVVRQFQTLHASYSPSLDRNERSSLRSKRPAANAAVGSTTIGNERLASERGVRPH